MHSSRVLLTACVLAVLLADNALAQASLEEVVVTARKREENVQDIPLSVTAFSSAEIEKAGFVDLEDIALNTPGMQFNTTLSGTRPGRLFSNLRFRGIEAGDRSTLATASMFMDGIYVLQGAQSMALTDLERVEIIKGPQSAVFARNSFAGAINYVTTTPNLNEFKGRITVDGGQYDQYEVSGSVELPLIADHLSLRIGAWLYNKGEMYTASDGGALGEQASEAIFATLYAKPNDAISIKVRAYYQEDDDGPSSSAYLIGRLSDNCTGTSRPGYDVTGDSVTLHPVEFICGSIPDPGQGLAPRVDSNTGLSPRFPSMDPDFLRETWEGVGSGISGVPSMDSLGLRRDMMRLSLVGDYAFDSGHTATIAVAYNENKANSWRDWDFSSVESWWVANPQKGTDKSVDIRIESSADQRLRWLGGLNYYDQEFVTSAQDGVLVHVCGNFAALFDPSGASGEFCDFPFAGTTGLNGSDFAEVKSIYGSIGFDITERLTLDIEGRYQEDERGEGISDFSKTFKDFIPRVTLSYKFSEDVMVYGLVTEGVLPGVVNAPILNCQDITYTEPFISPITGQPSTSSECEQYREQLGNNAREVTAGQSLDAIELGLKGIWADGRIQTNVAFYYQEWVNSPSFFSATIIRDNDGDGIPNQFPNGVPIGVPGGAEYYGIELESTFIPTENWLFDFNVSYNSSEFTDLHMPVGAPANILGTTNVKGNKAGRFPEWSGSLASTYTRSLSNGFDMYTRWDVDYMGKAPAGLTNLAYIQSYYLVNARLGVEKQDMRFEIYVKNLLDEDSWSTGQEFPDFTLFGNGFDFSHMGLILIPQDKRTFGIRASYNF